jgi:hypothetical protein
MNNRFRVYHDPADIGTDGYPHAWHGRTPINQYVSVSSRPIKDIVREQAGHRCERCHHPYRTGEHGNGQWTPCDEHCTHRGPVQIAAPDGVPSTRQDGIEAVRDGWIVQAEWRILTVHHLNGVKHDCRWWNLAALCQRCHLSIQTRVVMNRVYILEHTDWFKPHAAGWYAWTYLGEDLTREQTLERLDELLALEQA